MKKKRLSFPALLFLCATLVFAFPALGTGQEQAVPQGLLLVLGDAAREGEPLVRLETGPFTGLSRRSLLRAAFQVLGWGHELDLSEAFFPEQPGSRDRQRPATTTAITIFFISSS